MTHARRALPFAAILALFALVAAFGLVPLDASGADHLDAPGLTSPGGDGRLDINDLYVFEGSDSDNTVLAVTVNPAATGDTKFAAVRDGSYHIRIDTDGDALEDITYSMIFLNRIRGDGQFLFVRRATGEAAQDDRPRGSFVGFAATGKARSLRGDHGTVFAGLRSDPFFFDLGGFLGTVEGADNDRMFNDGNETDFFEPLNTLAIVLEVPDENLGDNPAIGVWATTSVREDRRNSSQVDRIGRPAINTVVNSSAIVGDDSNAKNVYNQAKPVDDVASFTDGVVAALLALSGGTYTEADAAGLAAVLLPDVLTYDTGTAAAGPLNGRALADDVIDAELAIVTNGAITTDGIGPHDDYLDEFPYLGEPHGEDDDNNDDD